PDVPSGAATAPAAPGAEPRTVALASLTPEQRRDWPPLTIGGTVYSDHPASRFVIIGGQLVREGDAAAPGVTVERIGPHSALMRWRELRVEVPY
ncbi:MAG: general secretion pathway protein GspB, partial [Rubrivivax sp.]|nr:general secretion pathway protein GspB [Rubrivivax sp.]